MPTEVIFTRNYNGKQYISVVFKGHAVPSSDGDDKAPAGEDGVKVCAAVSGLASYFEELVAQCADGWWIEAERGTPSKKITWIGNSPEIQAAAGALEKTLRLLETAHPGLLKVS